MTITWKQTLLIAGGVAVATGLIFAAQHLNRISEARKPFVIDFEAVKRIPPERIGYVGAGEIACATIKAPRGIAVGANGRVFIVGDRRAIAITKDATPASSWDLDFAPQSVAVDADGVAFVGGEARIVRLDKAGKVAPVARLDGDAMVYSLAVTDDAIFVGDPMTRCVWKLDRSGKVIAKMGREDAAKRLPKLVVPSPSLDVAVDTTGALWMVNPGALKLQQLRDDGSLASSWGVNGAQLEAFSGCCNPAHVAVLPDGSFVTAEKGLDRVKVHSAAGKFVTAVAGADQFQSEGGELDVATDGAGRIYVLDPAAGRVRIFVKKTN